MKRLLPLFFIAIGLWSCSNNGPKTPAELAQEKELADQSAAQLFADIYNPENLYTVLVTINNNIDNILDGAKGTKIRISKNTFVDEQGNPITGDVEIEIKEAIFPFDWAMANLQTTYNGAPLESGGMIYLNATSANKQVAIGESKAIQIRMLTDSTLSGMSLFEGNMNSGIVNWENPTQLMPPQVDSEADESFDLVFEKSHNLMYNVVEFDDLESIPDSVHDEVSRIAWEGAGLKITKDSIIEMFGYHVRLFKQDTLTRYSQIFSTEQGQNSYITDQNTSYIFSMNKLGWANIDRLLEDPRTEEVELLTTVDNESDFDYVYLTMITEKMYLPGYQKKDDSFSFTHGDYELAKLPVGAKALIMATAYQDGKVYFDFQTITIQKKQEVELDLVRSDKNEIEYVVSSEI